MSAVLAPLSLQTVLDLAGRPQVGATCLVYAAGTLDPATVCSDAGLATPLQQPVRVTGSGRLPPMYLGTGAFRFRVFDSRGGLLDDVDGIQGAAAAPVTPTTPPFAMPTAAVQAIYSTNCPDGWVRANGRTIGGPGSGATELGDASAQALYVSLWNSDPNLAVTGGRGVTATADFQAGKPLALPDLRRKALVGLDGVGSAALGGPSAFGQLGVATGEETHALAAAELAAHAHAGTTDAGGDHTHATALGAAGGHTHAVATEAAGNHTHGASTDQQGQHVHTGTTDNVGDHAHVYNYDVYQLSATYQASGQGVAYAGVQHNQPNTQTGGAHTHQLQMQAAGAHNHNVTVANAGGHVHTVDIAAAPDHVHTLAVGNSGPHTHTFTTSSAGVGAAHNNVQPSVPVMWILKL